MKISTIVLHPSELPDSTGQLTLFYDDQSEPPDPDDFKNLDEYRRAWDEWNKNYPQSADYLNQLQVKSVRMQKSSPELRTNKVAYEQSSNESPPEKITQWVELYYVKRSSKKHYYYRYCWMNKGDRKINYRHIGSSVKAIEKVQLVKQAIARRESPPEILQLIKTTK